MAFEGHDKLTLNEEGNAVISVKTSDIILSKPNSYQNINEIKAQVNSKYIVSDSLATNQ
ncbi:hypothetical protein [Romboutsia sp.]|uniref:DUF7948 domain-containing protein n=1 Tax=Romboutsia sp. TaxID=1965302 RepID=UPI003F2B1FEA